MCDAAVLYGGEMRQQQAFRYPASPRPGLARAMLANQKNLARARAVTTPRHFIPDRSREVRDHLLEFVFGKPSSRRGPHISLRTYSQHELGHGIAIGSIGYQEDIVLPRRYVNFLDLST